MQCDKSWIGTSTGRKFWPLAPRVEDVCIEDIAHHLSIECRFTGATRHPYSVAQHCVLCSHIVPPEQALWGLLHDASEAYLKDLPRPVKHHPALQFYREAEGRLMQTIATAFGLCWPMPDAVKAADDVLCQTERRDLLPPCPDWTLGVEPLCQPVVPWQPAAAEQTFLARFRELYQPFRHLSELGLMPRPAFAGN